MNDSVVYRLKKEFKELGYESEAVNSAIDNYFLFFNDTTYMHMKFFIMGHIIGIKQEKENNK